MKNKLAVAIASVMIAVLVLVLFGCGEYEGYNADGISDYSPSAKYSRADSSNSVSEPQGTQEGGTIVKTTDRLLIYTVSMSVTVEDFEQSKNTLVAKLGELNGYVEESREYSSGSRYYVFRVPTVNLDEFVTCACGIGQVESKTVNTEDVTDSYLNAGAKKQALELQKQALEDLLDKATTMDDVIKLTSEIFKLAEQIDGYQDTMSGYLKRSELSTVRINLYGESEYVYKPFWTRLQEVFGGSFESIGYVLGGILFAIVAVVPYLVLFGVVFGIYALIKFIVCKKKGVEFILFPKARDRKILRKKKAEELHRRAQQALEEGQSK